MEAAGLGVGVIGLVSLFNTCIDVVERWDSYKAFGLELGSLRARFNADRVRFRQWGEHVGIGEGKQGGHQHSALNDPSVRSAIDLILNSIKNIDNDARKAAPHLGDFSALTGLDLGVGNIAPDLISEKTSRRGRLGWALGGKARMLMLVGSFEALVRKLYDLIPPTSDTIKSDGVTTSIEDALADLAKYIRNETQEVLRDWLDAPDAKRNYDDFVLRRLDGTCEWILGRPEFQQWQSFSPEHPNILWINGPPGYGKTILCARIVEHLLVNSQRNTAYFFFSSEIDGREDPYVVIRSWISQLVHQTQQAFNMAQGKWEASDGRTASKLDIKALFNDIIRNLPPSTFIVDGLDECADVDQRDILFNFLAFLTSIVSESKSQLLVVSRNDYRIREGLCASNHDMKQIFTEFQIFPTHVIDDASAFSLDIIGRKLGNKSTAQQEELANKLVDRCEAMFLAIKLLEDDLRGGRNLKQLRRTIDQAPSKLDHIYDRNWERIQHLETDSKQRAFLILRWVTFAIRPLTVLEITECLLIPDTEDSEIDYEELPDVIDKIYINTEILELCNSLIEIRTEPNSDLCSSTIHLTHFSVRQYILCHMLSHGINLVINEQLRASNESIHNNALAQTCLRYLTLDQTWKKLQPKKNSNTMIQAFRDYATNLWYHHVKRGVSNSAETIQQINAFFQFSNPKWDSWRKHSADFIQNSILSLEKEDPIGNPVLYASVLGLFETVDHLIEKEGLEVDLVGSSGTTALVAVSSIGHMKSIAYLLKKQANVNAGNSTGVTPLYAAVAFGRVDMVMLLLEHGGDPERLPHRCRWTPSQLAFLLGYTDIACLFLERGADVHGANQEGVTLLHLASFNGNPEAVQLLLEMEVDVHAKDNMGISSLFIASYCGHTEIVQLLLENGATPNRADQNGTTPLLMASIQGHTEVVKLLLENGATSNKADQDGTTPLINASRKGHTEVVKLLLENGATLNKADQDGTTPLAIASMNGHMSDEGITE